MELKSYQNILGIQIEKNAPIWGFHANNLDLAQITPELFRELNSTHLNSKIKTASELQKEINEWNHEIATDTQDAFDSHEIRRLSLNVVQICNLRCTYCAAAGDGTYGSNTKKLDLKKAENQIRHFISTYDLEKNPTFAIQFLGGEPLLHPHVIKQLCTYAKLCIAGTKKTLEFSVTTNGTLITPEIAQMLAEFNFAVTLSLDGNAEINDRTRPTVAGSKNSTEMTINGLKELLKVKLHLTSLRVNSVVWSPQSTNNRDL